MVMALWNCFIRCCLGDKGSNWVVWGNLTSYVYVKLLVQRNRYAFKREREREREVSTLKKSMRQTGESSNSNGIVVLNFKAFKLYKRVVKFWHTRKNWLVFVELNLLLLFPQKSNTSHNNGFRISSTVNSCKVILIAF